MYKFKLNEYQQGLFFNKRLNAYIGISCKKYAGAEFKISQAHDEKGIRTSIPLFGWYEKIESNIIDSLKSYHKLLTDQQAVSVGDFIGGACQMSVASILNPLGGSVEVVVRDTAFSIPEGIIISKDVGTYINLVGELVSAQYLSKMKSRGYLGVVGA